MDVSKKKLSQDQMGSLYCTPIQAIRPFALMLAPVYVYFRANEKFLCIKSPLDFFTNDELKRFESFKDLYFSAFIESVNPFKQAGLRVREYLNWKTLSHQESSKTTEQDLSPVPYILSDRILRAIGPLWWDSGDGEPSIEPFLVTVFVNEVCETLPGDKLIEARERDIHVFENALMISSWAVFLALHLGYCDLKFLNALRFQLFDSISFSSPIQFPESEMNSLVVLARETFQNSSLKAIQLSQHCKQDCKIAQKLKSRLARVARDFVSRGEQPPSIYGARGFVDV